MCPKCTLFCLRMIGGVWCGAFRTQYSTSMKEAKWSSTLCFTRRASPTNGVDAMISRYFTAFVIVALGCAALDIANAQGRGSSPAVKADRKSADAAPTTGSAPTILKPLTEKEQEELLATRLKGGMGYSFSQFANMFLIPSRIYLGSCRPCLI